MNRTALFRLAALALGLLLAGCHHHGQQGKALKIGLVTDVGGLNDEGFNASAYRGLRQARKELHVLTNVIESKQQTDYEKNMRQFADAGYDLVVSVGFMMGDATLKVARQFPAIHFCIIDYAYPQPPPNLLGNVFREEQGAYLAGVLAATTSKTGKIGFVGGMDVPIIHKFEKGYDAGAQAGNPAVKVLSGYSGSFTDPAKGKEVALAQYQQGADVIFQAAGASGIGVVEAAREQHQLAIGVDTDQHHLAPDNVLTSELKRVDMAVYRAVQRVVSHSFKGGTAVYGLAD
ncbi:MAG: BMP family ABC transporter substrate-binding protein, partial [Chloroflexi bacterium]|nr:BMP family ABC transporter substrate-binding protein [Chloroflexota bacterium]